MPIDTMLVKQRLAFISQNLEELVQLSRLPEREFFTARNIAATESFLRRTLEAIFDIGRHILAKNGGLTLALEYRGIALGLQEKDVIDKDLAERLVKMAGYRNRLVHLYHQITDEELFQIIRTNLADIRMFVKQINQYIISKDDRR